MKTYTRIDDNCALVEEEGKTPYVVKLDQRQENLLSLIEQKNKIIQRETYLIDEITQIQNALSQS